MRQPIHVLIHPVRQVDGGWEYLLLRRAPDRGGFWQGVTGGVEGQEALAEAARRELAEETGLVPSTLDSTGYSYSFGMRDEWRPMYAPGVEEIIEDVFVALVDASQEPALSWEHDRWEWCTFECTLWRLRYAENIGALKHCEQYLNGRKAEG
jgi:8-oxo-dGTP pyrophosphatase MutT (NUDIX family)